MIYERFKVTFGQILVLALPRLSEVAILRTPWMEGAVWPPWQE